MLLKQVSLESLAELADNTMISHLGIEFTELGEESISARMPVDNRTVQPFGLLHGGANVTLAETLGSLASTLTVDPDEFLCVGQEINANHLRSARNGWVFGKVRPIHIGKRSHVWEVNVMDEENRLICISRMTIAVIARRK